MYCVCLQCGNRRSAGREVALVLQVLREQSDLLAEDGEVGDGGAQPFAVSTASATRSPPSTRPVTSAAAKTAISRVLTGQLTSEQEPCPAAQGAAPGAQPSSSLSCPACARVPRCAARDAVLAMIVLPAGKRSVPAADKALSHPQVRWPLDVRKPAEKVK